jgi:hypothetical protein
MDEVVSYESAEKKMAIGIHMVVVVACQRKKGEMQSFEFGVNVQDREVIFLGRIHPYLRIVRIEQIAHSLVSGTQQ